MRDRFREHGERGHEHRERERALHAPTLPNRVARVDNLNRVTVENLTLSVWLLLTDYIHTNTVVILRKTSYHSTNREGGRQTVGDSSEVSIEDTSTNGGGAAHHADRIRSHATRGERLTAT